MESSHLAIILLVIALCLLTAEVFIPSGGMILITALVCLSASVWFAWRAWGDSPVAWWSYIATLIILIPAIGSGVIYWFPHTTMGKRMLLDGPELTEVVPYSEEVHKLSQLIGHRGKSMTLLNPGGMVIVEGERYHCESQSLIIEPDEEIEVVGVSGTRLVVRPATTPVSRPPSEPRLPEDTTLDKTRTNNGESPPGDTIADDWPLDFEVPHS